MMSRKEILAFLKRDIILVLEDYEKLDKENLKVYLTNWANLIDDKII